MTSGLSSKHSSQPSNAPGDIFATRQWSVVFAAGRKRTPQADAALEELCRTYWFPLYAYVRRRAHSKEDAEDLTQAFFARFLEKIIWQESAARKGSSALFSWRR